jgi:AAA+ superfamily predicted ATPase/ATP-dependent Clp protease adapter protein ClpS
MGATGLGNPRIMKDIAVPSGPPIAVILRNDQSTPFGFVCGLLEAVFSMRKPEAQKLASDCHLYGEATVGRYPPIVAEAMIAECRRRITEANHKLDFDVRDTSLAARDCCTLCGQSSRQLSKFARGNVCEACMIGVTQNVRAETSRHSFAHSYELLQWHFAGYRTDEIITTSRTFPANMRADVHVAIHDLFAGRSQRFVGIAVQNHYEPLTFTALLQAGNHAKAIAPVTYEEVDTGEDAPISCPANGLWLIEEDALRMAILVARNYNFRGESSILVEVAAPKAEDGPRSVEAKFNALAAAVGVAPSYRGKVLSFERGDSYSRKSTGIMVHRLPKVERSEVILPAATLRLLERNFLDFARNRGELKKLGLSAKKGILLYGPPGTGKTHTIRYLAGALPDHTTLLVTSEQAALIGEYFTLARLLQPSLLVIEDADLIARAREDIGGPCAEVLLNKLLNEMDGLKEDADIFFILTTNRPEQLEGALTGRPGRIDQAIEFPLPDKTGREKLVKLYAGSLKIGDDIVTEIVNRTEGVSAAFIKELMRRAAQSAIERDPEGVVIVEDIDSTLQDMLFRGGRLNASLLGASAVAPG